MGIFVDEEILFTPALLFADNHMILTKVSMTFTTRSHKFDDRYARWRLTINAETR